MFGFPASLVRRGRSWFVRVCVGGLLASLCCGCKGSGSDAPKPAAQLGPEPERFQFVLLEGSVPRELRGDGSETLLVPADAQVRAQPYGVSVEAGFDFALEIQFQSVAALPATPPGTQRVLSESDLVIFSANGSYAFVAVRELVPEWDESDRRRISCGSAGVSAGAAPRGFSRAAVERMVAACRSLSLPRLE